MCILLHLYDQSNFHKIYFNTGLKIQSHEIVDYIKDNMRIPWIGNMPIVWEKTCSRKLCQIAANKHFGRQNVGGVAALHIG